MRTGPAVQSLGQVAGLESSPGVTVREMLTSDHGCRGLNQRRVGFAGGARLAGTAGGRGEAWYVISGTGALDTERTGHLALAPGTAVWLSPGLGYACAADDALEVLAVTVRAGSAAAGPARPGYLDLPAAADAALPGEHRPGHAAGARGLPPGRKSGRQAGLVRRQGC